MVLYMHEQISLQALLVLFTGAEDHNRPTSILVSTVDARNHFVHGLLAKNNTLATTIASSPN